MPRLAGWRLENTYASLGAPFLTQQAPVAVSEPGLTLLNRPLATRLGLDPEVLSQCAALFSGNELPAGATPIAQAYAGHQFGHFTMLGDGRAVLLGEQIDPQGHRWDVQLKGSGRTPYSRRGDGRAALGPMLREYLISEAMAGLGIPTTRSLAVATTGQPVYRETTLHGAILTRVAASHIRVGTFEYAARFHGVDAVRKLADYTIARHDPDLANANSGYLEFLKRVIARQARLIAQWMQVGFIHGVMNTDNMLVSGETIDYGPCAFMDQYDPGTVFSSIDENGRYAYGNQPLIAHWNLTRLAETLLPLLHEETESAIQIAKQALDGFSTAFSDHWRSGMRRKLGIDAADAPGDDALIEDLLTLMQRYRLDFTLTFRALTHGQKPLLPESTAAEAPDFSSAWASWAERWQSRAPSIALMTSANPEVIPRNHHVEAALLAAVTDRNLGPLERLLEVLQRPYEDRPENAPYLDPAPASAEPYRTFCGT